MKAETIKKLIELDKELNIFTYDELNELKQEVEE